MSPAIRDSRMQTCLQPSWPGCAQEVVARARTPGPSTPAETRRRRSPTADPPDHHPRRRSESRPGPLVWPAKAPPKPPMKPEIKEEQPSGSEEDEKGRGNDEKKKAQKTMAPSEPPTRREAPALGGQRGGRPRQGASAWPGWHHWGLIGRQRLKPSDLDWPKPPGRTGRTQESVACRTACSMD